MSNATSLTLSDVHTQHLSEASERLRQQYIGAANRIKAASNYLSRGVPVTRFDDVEGPIHWAVSISGRTFEIEAGRCKCYGWSNPYNMDNPCTHALMVELYQACTAEAIPSEPDWVTESDAPVIFQISEDQELDPQWSTAVAAEAGIMEREPFWGARLEKARRLVNRPWHFQFLEDDTVRVRSLDGKTVYHFDPLDSCTCADATKAGTEWCYHRVGVELFNGVLERRGMPRLTPPRFSHQSVSETEETEMDSNGTQETQDAPAGTSLQGREVEAITMTNPPSRITLKWVDEMGMECLWTMEDVSDDEIMKRVVKARPKIHKQIEAAQAKGIGQPTQNRGGGGNRGGQGNRTQRRQNRPWCGQHQSAWFANEDGTWSHKTQDGGKCYAPEEKVKEWAGRT